MQLFWQHGNLILISLVVLVISRFGFEDRVWVLIAQDPDHCLLFSFVCILKLLFNSI